MKIKVRHPKTDKEINPKDFVVGKLYNYTERDGKESGVILIVKDDYCTLRFRVVELIGDLKEQLWGEDPAFVDFVFTEFKGKLEISN